MVLPTIDEVYSLIDTIRGSKPLRDVPVMSKGCWKTADMVFRMELNGKPTSWARFVGGTEGGEMKSGEIAVGETEKNN